MEIRVVQNQTGKFNLLGNETTFNFYMGIYKDGKCVEVDGIKALLHYEGESDDQWYFENPIDTLQDVAGRCLAYCFKIISTRNHKEECLTFLKVYHENFDEIDTNLTNKRKAEIAKKIASLQRELAAVSFLSNDLHYTQNSAIDKEIKTLSKWRDDEKIKLNDFKEGTDSYVKSSDKISGYQKRIDRLESFRLTENIGN